MLSFYCRGAISLKFTLQKKLYTYLSHKQNNDYFFFVLLKGIFATNQAQRRRHKLLKLSALRKEPSVHWRGPFHHFLSFIKHGNQCYNERTNSSHGAIQPRTSPEGSRMFSLCSSHHCGFLWKLYGFFGNPKEL